MNIFGLFTGDFFVTILAVIAGLFAYNSFFAGLTT